MDTHSREKVGDYVEKFNLLTGQSIPCGPIYQSEGLKTHVAKRHPEQLKSIPDIPLILSQPDYIGHNPKEPNSIELIKALEGNMKVCVKLDIRNQYLYVATLFEITDSKLQRMLQSGRIQRY